MKRADSYPSQYLDCICRIRERFAPTAYKALLPNGKETVAFVEKKEARLLEVLRPGSRVIVTICPADFDKAHIRRLVD